jgi:peptide-methionine (R)-S-oxide reductase
MWMKRRAILGSGTGLLMVMNFPALARGRAEAFPFRLSEAQWKSRLSPAAYTVLRKHGTERAGTSPLDGEKRRGSYHCAGCDQPLFRSAAKFDSGTGWPSFFAAMPGAVGLRLDRAAMMVRTEVHCARCGGHLGHRFNDGPRPTGHRYCMNGVALRFWPA